MPTSDIARAVEGFFESYSAAFGQENAPAIADHYAYPSHISSDEGTVALAAVGSRTEWIPRVETLLATYRQIGFRSAKIAGLAVAELSPLLVQARVRWELCDAAGDLLYDFDTTYTLGRFNRELRIVQAISHNELLRHRAFVDAKATETSDGGPPRPLDPALFEHTFFPTASSTDRESDLEENLFRRRYPNALSTLVDCLKREGMRDEQTARFLEQFMAAQEDSPIVDEAVTLAKECLPSCYSIQALDVLGPQAWTSPTALRYLAGQLRFYAHANAAGQRWSLEVSVSLHDAIHRALANARKQSFRKSRTSFDDAAILPWKAAKRPRLEYARILLWSEEDLLDPTATVVVDIHRAFHVPLFFLNTARTARAFDFICFHCAKKDAAAGEARRSVGCVNSWHPERHSFVLSQFRDGIVRGDASDPKRGVLAADLFGEYLANDDLMFAADAKRILERNSRPLRAVRASKPGGDEGG
jgi:hypothetical protein